MGKRSNSNLLKRQLRLEDIDLSQTFVPAQKVEKLLERVDGQYQKFQTQILTLEKLRIDAGQTTQGQDLGEKVAKVQSHLDIEYEETQSNITKLFLASYIPAWFAYGIFYILFNVPIAAVSCLTLGMLSAALGFYFVHVRRQARLGAMIGNYTALFALLVICYTTGGAISPIFEWLFFILITSYLICGPLQGHLHVVLMMIGALAIFLIHIAGLMPKNPPELIANEHYFYLFATLTHISSMGLGAFVTNIFHRQQTAAYERVREANQQINLQAAKLEQQKEALQFQQSILSKQKTELEAANSHLKHHDEQKTMFYQMISHELRTPLTLIMHPLELLQQKLPDNPELEVCRRNAHRLLRLVNQLLDIQKVRVQSGQKELGPVRLSTMIGELGRSFAYICNKKAIQLDFRLSKEELIAYGFQDSLEKIILNFLSNAWKHTPEGGRILIAVDSRDGRIQVSVHDSGSGVPADKRDRLFQVFSQLDGAANRQYEGTGLGLALTKELVATMNGQVGYRESEYGGACFWLEVPEAPLGAEQGIELSPSKRAEIEFAVLQRDDQISTPLQVGTESQARILIVDDIHDLRELLASYLKNWGYHVMQAMNGSHAIELAEQQLPDLIITDWMMPGMTGPELIKELRTRPAFQGTPIILLTAKADEASRIEAIGEGANAYLGKPFDTFELRSQVENLLQLKKTERDLEAAHRYLVENVLRRFVPPPLVEEISKGRVVFDQSPRVKTVTVLFADICNFTSLSDELGALSIAQILNACFKDMTQAVFAHQGIVDKFMGDGLMAIFGAFEGTPGEEQVRQAIACARELHLRLAALNETWQEKNIPRLQLRIGVNHGPAVVGTFGSEHRMEFTAIGPTVNMAFRIESVATAGSTYFSDKVRDYLEPEAWEKAGEFQLKGLRNSSPLFKLREPSKAVAA